jgi:hypothetical protein
MTDRRFQAGDAETKGPGGHLEAFFPFTEAVKLEKGNANLRPPSETKKPFQDMVATVTVEGFDQCVGDGMQMRSRRGDGKSSRK